MNVAGKLGGTSNEKNYIAVKLNQVKYNILLCSFDTLYNKNKKDMHLKKKLKARSFFYFLEIQLSNDIVNCWL